MQAVLGYVRLMSLNIHVLLMMLSMSRKNFYQNRSIPSYNLSTRFRAVLINYSNVLTYRYAL